jgi:hypothetical protein
MTPFKEKKEAIISKARRVMMRLMEEKEKNLWMEELEKMN